MTAQDPKSAFIRASVWHGSLDEAAAILAAHPEIAGADIHTAAILGDDEAVRRFLALDPASATSKSGTLGWDALTLLCFSRYLRLDPSRSAGFVRSAEALLDAGADANTGFWEQEHQPEPCFESALYGAAGLAFHAELTRLLVQRGADPNDAEVPYHSPETYDLGALKALVVSGNLNADSLTTMLLRKSDWHDYHGIDYLLQHGADPNRMTRWGFTAFQQAIRRDNALDIVDLLLDRGADPTLSGNEGTGVALAAGRGRADVLASLERRRIPLDLSGADRLIAACARDDAAAVSALVREEPALVAQVVGTGGSLLARFAGNGNTPGVRSLLDLGVSPSALYLEGDGYFEIAKRSTALHVAAWRIRPDTVRLLIERGADVNARDAAGRTPLASAVRGCVESYWTERRTPQCVMALLAAGASTEGARYPTGYAEIDDLLRVHGAAPSAA